MTDGELAAALSVNKSTVRNWRYERVVPTDDAMLVLCSFAAIEPQCGMILLNIWRSKGRTRATYMEALKIMAREKRISPVTLLPLTAPTLANTETAAEQIHTRL